jgi:hypothetical protein
MESTPSIWKSCLKYGLIMGLVSIVMSMLFYMLDLTFASWIIIPSLIISFAALFLLQRSYRDTYENGYISYGRSLGAGVIITIYSAIIGAIFGYLLFTVIDPGLIQKSLAFAQAKVDAKGGPEAAMEAAKKMQEKLMKPFIMSLMGIFFTVFYGFILSLISSIFVAKQGNPLLENEK